MSDDSAVRAAAEKLNQLFADVEEEALERHDKGAEQYGPLKFLGADTLQEALEEVLDLINYARYTAVKIKLLQEVIAQKAADTLDTDTTGGGFIPTSSLIKDMGGH